MLSIQVVFAVERKATPAPVELRKKSSLTSDTYNNTPPVM